jgi:hypothetical protein
MKPPRRETRVLVLKESGLTRHALTMTLPGQVFRSRHETILETAPLFVVQRSGDLALVELGPPKKDALKRALAGLQKKIGGNTVRRFSMSVTVRSADFLKDLTKKRALLRGATAQISFSVVTSGSKRPIVSRRVTTTVHARSRVMPGPRANWIAKPLCVAFFACHSHWAFWAVPLRPLIPNTRCCGPCGVGGCKCADVADTHFLSPIYCYDIGWCECR